MADNSRQLITIRFFKTKKEALSAAKILKSANIYSEISEDKFEGVPIQKYGVPARYRLKILAHDLNQAALYLYRKLKRH